ncbi:glycosyl transferase family 90-domain-containing protein [Naematelia encephala]|uniref:Glycosyl transferase family 90-domain-containing protein n=1 Tax=Naematelia encephala TaxID=71784 RepID=A0A1Y2BH25_9TREE|nr:glycosyl transferase family 90-domain-containing protein [Naematelia encephala]
MLRVSRPILAILALLSIILLHYLFSSPSSPPAPPRKASRRQSLSRPKTHGAPSYKHPVLNISPDDELEVDDRGYTAFKPGQEKHPVELLIERGKALAAAMEARIEQVGALADVVTDYEKGYGMKPPRGFDKWYEFTQQTPLPHTPPLATLYPFSHNPILPFLSHPAEILRERMAKHTDKPGMFTFTFVPNGQGDKGTACTADQSWKPVDWNTRGKGMVKVRGGGAWKYRSNNTLSLLLPILPLMPPEMFTQKPPLEVVFSIDDGPRCLMHDNFRERSESLGRQMKLWSPPQLVAAENAMKWTYGWQWTCPEESPLRRQNTDMVLNDLVRDLNTDFSDTTSNGSPKSFIADFDRSIDVCQNPEMMGLEIEPVIVTCKTARNSDLLGVPLDSVWESVDFVPWEEKPIGKAFWRGSTTGVWHSTQIPWRHAQRERLHFMVHNDTDAKLPILLDRAASGGGLETQMLSISEMNEAWFDAGLTGGPHQCTKEDGTCDDMNREIHWLDRVKKEDAAKYKYVIDVDGNGWSSRFRRLLAGNNVVLKSTLFPEWFQDVLIPWYHYVPIKLDYSDMYDILAFFNGSPDGSAPGRDDLAKEIALNGWKFTQERWRTEDMQSFMFLLLLEYWRIMSDDRLAASYQG